MSEFVRYTTPAERMAGCVASFGFAGKESVVRQGGELFGNPEVDGRLTLDGVEDYTQYTLNEREFPHTQLSVSVEFWPSFAADDGASRYIIDADVAGGNRTIITKRGDNVLLAYHGTTQEILVSAYATYSPYWLVGQRNIIETSCDSSGNNVLRLNGHDVATSATVWTPQTLRRLTVGARYSGDSHFFPGSIGSVKVWNRLRTLQEHIDTYNHATYDYMDDAILHLPMGMEQHDPTNTQTLDVSGNGNDCALGDGAGNNEPVKTVRRGYQGNGTSQYLAVTNTIGTHPEGAIAVAFVVGEFTETQWIMNLYQSFSRAWGVILQSGRLKLYDDLGNAGVALGLADANPGDIMTAVFSLDSGALNTLYVNGVDTGITRTSLNTFDDLYLAYPYLLQRGPDQGYSYTTVFSASVFGRAITATQAADLHIRMTKGVNNV